MEFIRIIKLWNWTFCRSACATFFNLLSCVIDYREIMICHTPRRHKEKSTRIFSVWLLSCLFFFLWLMEKLLRWNSVNTLWWIQHEYFTLQKDFSSQKSPPGTEWICFFGIPHIDDCTHIVQWCTLLAHSQIRTVLVKYKKKDDLFTSQFSLSLTAYIAVGRL